MKTKNAVRLKYFKFIAQSKYKVYCISTMYKQTLQPSH